MLKVSERDLAAQAAVVLALLQRSVDAQTGYIEQVAAAQIAWEQKTSTASKASAFRTVRQTLAQMCVGPVRCAYCEDSLADEIEHIHPKSLFPGKTFAWRNFLFACGPCNGPKNNRYGVISGGALVEVVRRRGEPVLPPPTGLPALIDPRLEDPLTFLEMDLGGVTPSGVALEGTFEILPADGLSFIELSRAQFTIDVLGLNREVTRVARQNAFGGYRARLREYAQEKEHGATAARLAHLQDDILSTPHLTVFAEIRRQRHLFPDVNEWFELAPEALAWPLTAKGAV